MGYDFTNGGIKMIYLNIKSTLKITSTKQWMENQKIKV